MSLLQPNSASILCTSYQSYRLYQAKIITLCKQSSFGSGHAVHTLLVVKTTALLTKMCYCSQCYNIYAGTSLPKGYFSEPILLLFVILCIYNFNSYMSKKYMTDSFLLSNLLASLAATQYPLSIFSFSLFFYITYSGCCCWK